MYRFNAQNCRRSKNEARKQYTRSKPNNLIFRRFVTATEERERNEFEWMEGKKQKKSNGAKYNFDFNDTTVYHLLIDGIWKAEHLRGRLGKTCTCVRCAHESVGNKNKIYSEKKFKRKIWEKTTKMCSTTCTHFQYQQTMAHSAHTQANASHENVLFWRVSDYCFSFVTFQVISFRVFNCDYDSENEMWDQPKADWNKNSSFVSWSDSSRIHLYTSQPASPSSHHRHGFHEIYAHIQLAISTYMLSSHIAHVSIRTTQKIDKTFLRTPTTPTVGPEKKNVKNEKKSLNSNMNALSIRKLTEKENGGKRAVSAKPFLWQFEKKTCVMH